MNRWLLSVAGIAAAGSAIAATTKPAPVAAPRRPAAVKTVPIRRGPTAIPTSTRLAAATTLEPVQASPAPATPPAVAPKPVVVEERDVIIRRQPAPVATDEEVEIEVDGKSGKVIAQRSLTGIGRFNALGLNDLTPEPLRKPISLEISNATPVEAVEALVKKVGVPIAPAFDKDLPSEPRITLKVARVSAGALLTLITQNAGLDWSMNSPGKGQTTQLRITKARPGSSKTAFSFLRSSIQDTGVGPVDIIFTPRAEGNHLALGHVFAGEQRLSLECPHCKVKSTIIRQRSQPKCAKCSRTFQGDWQFCPIDGSKRPADPNEWKFCPACGKKVEIEKAAVQEGGVPLLSDLPIVGDLFRSPNTPTPPRAFTPGGVEPMILPAVPGAAPRFLKRPAAPAPVPGIPAIPTPTEPVAPAPAPEPPVRAR